MTPPFGVELKEPAINWRNFHKACELAKQVGVVTAMFPGKGEPTLFPKQISKFMKEMMPYKFPIIELQTNGIKLVENQEKYDPYLQEWYNLGMTTIAISIVHYDPEKNREIYLPYRKNYIDLPKLIAKIHSFGFSVRLTCIAANGYIDSVEKLLELIRFAKSNKVKQLTLTPVNKPKDILNKEAWDWTNKHHLTPDQLNSIVNLLEDKERSCHRLTLSHGSKVYDLEGQNICLNYCLTVQPDAEELRNIIFYPDGHARPYWDSDTIYF